MNNGRLKSIMNNMSAMDEKIYNCVPIQEAWTVHQVSAEYNRLYRILPSYAGIEKTLKDMAEQGILRKTMDGKQAIFNRYVNKPQEPKEEEMPKQTATDQVANTPTLAARLMRVSNDLLELAETISSLAQEVEDQVSKPNPELEQLRKLKDAMKSFMI